MKTAVTGCWKVIRVVYLRFKAKSAIIDNNLISDKQKTSEAKFNEKRKNLDSDSKNGKQHYKQSKNVE